MTEHDFNFAILQEVAHRPWPMPHGSWLMTQTWHDLLFAHWPVDAGEVRNKVPLAFELDLFDGAAWIGVVAFRMTNVMPRGVSSLPWMSEFPELNVRTYVRHHDRPGVYFFSLDAGNVLAVRAAKILWNLPYHSASMTVSSRTADVEYYTHRNDAALDATLSATYWPIAAPVQPMTASLEHFLTERYCLYNLYRSGAPYRLDIHHPPWQLQRADAEFRRNTMADAAGIRLPDVKPLLYFSRRQDMVAWAPTRI